jgi:hypothetical protein
MAGNGANYLQATIMKEGIRTVNTFFGRKQQSLEGLCYQFVVDGLFPAFFAGDVALDFGG